MSITKEQIIGGLKKLGPCKPGALADHLGVDKLPPVLLSEMLGADEIKAVGATASRQIALPDQEFDTPAPPQERRERKKRKSKKAKKPRAPRAQRAAPAARPAADRFIATVDTEKRLVIINGHEPLIFTDEQTEAIATLLFQHYG